MVRIDVDSFLDEGSWKSRRRGKVFGGNDRRAGVREDEDCFGFERTNEAEGGEEMGVVRQLIGRGTIRELDAISVVMGLVDM